MRGALAVLVGGIALVALVGAGAVGLGLFDTGNGGGPTGQVTPTPASAERDAPTEAATPVASTPAPDESTSDGSGTAQFDVTIRPPDSPLAGQPVTVEAVVENTGQATGRQQISLQAPGPSGTEQRSLTLSGGASETVTFEWRPPASGTQEVSVASLNDTATATVDVRAAVAAFDVSIANTTGPVADRDPVAVTAEVRNTGTAGGTQRLALSRGDSREDATNVSLDAGASTTITLTWDPATPQGEQPLRVSSANDTAETTVTVEPIEEPAVAGQVFVASDDTVAEAGVVNLYQAGETDILASVDLEQSGGEFRFDELDPGTEYRLEVPSAVATFDTGLEVGPQHFPASETTFTAGEVQQTVDVTYGVELQGAQHYRWEFRTDIGIRSDFVGHGRYDEGEAYVIERTVGGDGQADRVIEGYYLDDVEYYRDTFKAAQDQFYNISGMKIRKPISIYHRIVQNPHHGLTEVDWEYSGQTYVDNSLVYEYDISGYEKFPDATIAIDPETGHVVSWEADRYMAVYGTSTNEGNEQFSFYDHGDTSITAGSPDPEDLRENNRPG